MYLVDTNVLSELPRCKPNARVLEWLGAQDSLAFSAITLEELTYGIARAPDDQKRRPQPWLDRLLAVEPLVIPVDDRIATAAGVLRAGRELAGRLAAQADMLIGATAAITGRVLVTRKVRDFEGCGIALLNPFA